MSGTEIAYVALAAAPRTWRRASRYQPPMLLCLCAYPLLCLCAYPFDPSVLLLATPCPVLTSGCCYQVVVRPNQKISLLMKAWYAPTPTIRNVRY
eukprot:1380794-Rhodomonas_salina.2